MAAVLSVTSDVVDAQVFIDDRLVSTVPVTELELPAKTIELSVRREGYKDFNKTLVLVAGRDYPVAVKLNAPLALKPPNVMTPTLRAPPSDWPTDTSLTPVARVDEPVSVSTSSPEEIKPLTQRWYFWAGAAAVVVAGTVGGLVLANTVTPPRKLTEQEICGGKCDACIGLQCVAGAAASGAGVVHW